MLHHRLALPLVLLLAVAASGLFWLSYDGARAASGDDEEEPELATYMGTMQIYAHKLALSVDAGNGPLARFYLHELEELAEEVETEVPSYDGHPVGELVAAMLMPRMEALEAELGGHEHDESQAALDAAAWEAAQAELGALVASCNQCHAATEHGYIEIALRTDVNPYLQHFAPEPAEAH